MHRSTLTTMTAFVSGAAVVAAALTLAGGADVAPAADQTPAAASTRTAGVDPTHFHGTGTNRYFPLEPGTTSHLRGHDGTQRFRETVTVTDDTRRIQDVKTTVVRDVVRRRDGTVAERTRDYYATADSGRVWYFGENTGTYRRDGSLVDHEGTWIAGKDGGRAGTIMPAHPRPTQAFRQEYRPDVAEDQAWIVENDGHARTPSHRYSHVVRSFEWADLEPGVISVKFYAPGVGLVTEKDLHGGHEVFHLVRTT